LVLAALSFLFYLFFPPAGPVMTPNTPWHCSDAPHSIFPTSAPLYPFFPVSFSVVLPLTF